LALAQCWHAGLVSTQKTLFYLTVKGFHFFFQHDPVFDFFGDYNQP